MNVSKSKEVVDRASAIFARSVQRARAQQSTADWEFVVRSAVTFADACGRLSFAEGHAARERSRRRVVRTAGAAEAEAYNMAERFQDVIAQAQHESPDPARRAALARAAETSRKLRDEIVVALGTALEAH